MELIRSISQLRPQHHQCVATIGNFDGVHRGHQTVIQQVKTESLELDLPATVIVFEPQPQEFFAPDKAPTRLTRLREKLLAFQRYGVDRVLCLRFDKKLSSLEPDDFIQQILIDGLGVKHLVVGDDFHFGKKRGGNYQTLQAAAKQHQFKIEKQRTFIIDGERVSSTRIRHALAQGNMQLANELLGRPYMLSGRVSYGQQRGRTINFPTANIFLHRHKSPLKGVFAVKVHGLGHRPITGVANLGTRPTINGTQLLLETHLFDFNQVIYGKYIEVEFISKIRDEQKFDSFELLKQQIELDAQAARHLFSSSRNYLSQVE
ncbi:bifunctional riboflavin kinase/FAD synthetase [Candidatus Albibeggiatoa sp. nov. NOAA]|uniref:bifunctional riboflavin kinase/FAD synthetase n=1 Tax=Candidatus Albibeggiatoa sp. nov. NOAA TaxID=3162724 RepID=UPI0032F3B1AE|nr:bifunctional riboflavin kinase/FAD synthetase [Thiotrichaceae bacterium]